MNVARREFAKYFTTAVLGARMSPSVSSMRSGYADHFPESDVHLPRFFKNSTFEFIFQIILGRAYYSAGNVGKILYIGSQIEDGNFESAYQAFKQAGDEAREIAEESAKRGHGVSARQAYLWAQNYYDGSTYFADGSADPSRFLPTWELYYDCWLRSAALSDQPIEAVNIPYEKTELHGFFFKVNGDTRRRPLLILVNGSDGSLLDMWVQGGAAAIARGYNCLTFDGPGQGYALWKQKLYFRPDWENVIAPVVDYALKRPDVDSHRIAVQGISQGGFWIPRAVAFEKRIAAAIADPGVVDVSTSWMNNIPEPMKQLLKAGRKSEFDGFMAQAMKTPAGATLRFRMRPYGFASPYDTYKAVQEYQLRDVARQIHCPMLITEPANEEFWPGQSRELYDLLTSPKQLVPFTVSEGADLHCEPNGIGLRDLRIFNWLDEVMK
jgi:hypothetical protein